MVVARRHVKQTLNLMAAATRANQETATRQGQVVVLDQHNSEELMVTADLHGQRGIFQRLLQRAALADHPQRHLLMQEVCHGGPSYPTEMAGCMSHLMLEDVARLKVDFPQQFHFILSNHELAEVIDFPITKARRMLNLVFRCGIQELYGDAADEIRQGYSQFLRSCPLAIRTASGIFVCHSAPEKVDSRGFDVDIFQRKQLDAGDLEENGEVFRLVWGRDFRPQNAAAFAKLVEAEVLIHGHEPCEAGFQAPNAHQVILDCCNTRPCYVVLPTAGDLLSQQQVLDKIEFLYG